MEINPLACLCLAAGHRKATGIIEHHRLGRGSWEEGGGYLPASGHAIPRNQVDHSIFGTALTQTHPFHILLNRRIQDDDNMRWIHHERTKLTKLYPIINE